nr:hypothetical protein [Mycobacterium sherrisii]
MEATRRYGALGYDVTVARAATADYSDTDMRHIRGQYDEPRECHRDRSRGGVFNLLAPETVAVQFAGAAADPWARGSTQRPKCPGGGGIIWRACRRGRARCR